MGRVAQGHRFDSVPHSGIGRLAEALAGESEIGEQPERNGFHEAQGHKATAAATSWPLAAPGRALRCQGATPRRWVALLEPMGGPAGKERCLCQEPHSANSQQQGPLPRPGGAQYSTKPFPSRSQGGPATPNRTAVEADSLLDTQAGHSAEAWAAGAPPAVQEVLLRGGVRSFMLPGPAPKQRDPIVSIGAGLFRRTMQAKRGKKPKRKQK